MTEPILLASASPRRRELLERVGFTLEVFTPALDEQPLAGESPEHYVCRIAEAKALQALHQPAGPRLIVAADTVVVHARRILGKPADREAARAMLRSLSGAWHDVYTAFVAVPRNVPPVALVVTTAVRMRGLDDYTLEHYLASGEWRDKAGAYGIQGLAAHLVAEVRGSYTNVVGLPLAEVVDVLARHGIRPGPARPGEAAGGRT
jgi:septum formation protein